MEPSPKPELPKKPSPEAKPASPTAAKEKPKDAKHTAEPGTPRATLEAIAAGKPVAEATKAVETMPSRESVTALLNEANILLLDLKDTRLWVNAIATQAADTPLGNEVRIDALRSVLSMDASIYPPETANQLTDLQAKVTALNLPEPNPGESAALAVITRYNEQNPGKEIPEAVMESIKSGKKEASTAVAEMMQSNNDLAQMTWKELTGVDGFSKLNPSPESMLDLAGIPKSPENVQKAQEIFGIAQTMKEPADFKGNLVMGLMYGALFVQFFNSVALGEGGGGH